MDHPEFRAVTVRLSRQDYERLRAHAGARNLSLNSVVNEAVAQYGRKIERDEALRQLEALRGAMAEAGGPGEDSVEMLARLRRERSDRLAQLADSPDPPDAPGDPQGPPRGEGGAA